MNRYKVSINYKGQTVSYETTADSEGKARANAASRLASDAKVTPAIIMSFLQAHPLSIEIKLLRRDIVKPTVNDNKSFSELTELKRRKAFLSRDPDNKEEVKDIQAQIHELELRIRNNN